MDGYFALIDVLGVVEKVFSVEFNESIGENIEDTPIELFDNLGPNPGLRAFNLTEEQAEIIADLKLKGVTIKMEPITGSRTGDNYILKMVDPETGFVGVSYLGDTYLCNGYD